MEKVLIFFLFYLSSLSNNKNVIYNYEKFQDSLLIRNIKEKERAEALQKADNKLLNVQLDNLYQRQYYVDYIEDKNLEREYYKSLIWRNRRRDYHKYRYHDEYKQYKYYY